MRGLPKLVGEEETLELIFIKIEKSKVISVTHSYLSVIATLIIEIKLE